MWKRKRTLKEEYGTLGHFLRGDNRVPLFSATCTIEGTNFYFHPRVARREGHGLCLHPLAADLGQDGPGSSAVTRCA